MKTYNSFRLLLIAAIFLFITGDISAQRLIRSTDSGVITAENADKKLGEVFKAFEYQRPTQNIHLRKLLYTTTDEFGKTANVSGLLAMPENGSAKGLVVYMHGTIWDRNAAPSRVSPKLQDNSSLYAVLALTSAGYAVAAPDYLGLGDHAGVHPYPLNIINARSGVDIIVPARTAANKNGYNISPQLFVTGYSEGGGTAMALTKLLEEQQGSMYRVTASAPASGPYDLSGVTREFLLEDVSGEDVIIRAYLLGYSISYFKKAHGIKTDDYFSKIMAMTVNSAFHDGRADKNILVRLAVAGKLTGGTRSVDRLLNKRFVTALENIDTNDIVIRTLQENNVYDWAPRTPMLLINLTTDKVVDPRNTDVAVNAMRKRGVGRDILRHLEITNPNYDHGTVAIEAMFHTINFFDRGFSAVPNTK